MSGIQHVRDPLHNIIEFGTSEFEQVMWRVVQTSTFQRLRRVKQLGLSEFVYPGATHSRFAHSLGVFHTARRLMKIVEQTNDYNEAKARHALAAALVHDIGHGPFSHAFEEVGRRLDLSIADHEETSVQLIRNGEIGEVLNNFDRGFANGVASIIEADSDSIYSAVVSSQFDADRIDYMQRDRLMTGAHHGAIDFEWLMANLEVASVPYGSDDEKIDDVQTFVLGSKAVYAAETYVLGLFQLYPTVYLHKTTRGAEKVLAELLLRVIDLGKDKAWKRTGLPHKHPLLAFARNQNSLNHVILLDDFVISGALDFLTTADDEVVKDLALRLRDRRLYKCIDVRERLRIHFGLNANTEIEKACESVKVKISDWFDQKQKDCTAPRIIMDEGERNPYKRLYESSGHVNQIMVKTSSGELVDLVTRSEVVAAIKLFKLYRVYVNDRDDEARTFIEQTIDAEVRNGSKT